MNLTWNGVDLDLAVFVKFCSILDSTCPKALIMYHRMHLKIKIFTTLSSRSKLAVSRIPIMHFFSKKYIILMRKEIRNEPVGQDAKEVRGPVK